MSRLVLDNLVPASYERGKVVEVIRQITAQLNALSEGRLAPRYASMAAAPTTGTYLAGDIIWNSTPSDLGGYTLLGWLCVLAGTPGTWMPLYIGNQGPSTIDAPVTKPVVADYTLDNAGTASMADGVKGIVLTMPSSTINIRFIRKNSGLPGSTWTAVMRGSMLTPYRTPNIHHNSFLLRNSGTGRILNFADNDSNFVLQRWTNYSAVTGGVVSAPASYGYTLGWKKVVCNGTTLSYYLSSNGVDWGLVATETLAAFIGTPDQIGFGSVNGAASGFTNVDLAESFAVT